ncbi:hypothetical protein [Planctomycetes bacterium K23_9]|uniref:VanZ like family protein n=1 Tax=Stieleria marina TaxID=1930275 RepID=A0A517NPN6_9BACT|nr:VanZ like family protein [Planctomycetes bacterium K23_9]
MNDLRRRAIAAAAALIALAIGLLLMPVPAGGRFYSSLGDLFHTPLFFGLTIITLLLLEKVKPAGQNRRRVLSRCWILGLSLFVFGVGMELVQHFAGRTAAIHDAVANGMGVLIGASTFLLIKRDVVWPGNRHVKRWFVGAVLAALVVAWSGPIVMLIDHQKMRSEFPMLSSFDSKAEISRWYFRESSAKLTESGATDGSYAMLVTFPQDQSSVTLVEMNADWTDVESLQMDLLFPGRPDGQQAIDGQEPEELMVLLSVVDRHHKNYVTDLFEKPWTLRRGKVEHITITRDEILSGPRDREMDLSQIRYVTVGLKDRAAPVEIIIDAVRLTLRD